MRWFYWLCFVSYLLSYGWRRFSHGRDVMGWNCISVYGIGMFVLFEAMRAVVNI